MKRRSRALNPVAKAVALAKLRACLVDAKIKLYLMDDGEACAEFLCGVGATLSVVGFAAEYQGIDVPEIRVLRGGLSAVRQMERADCYVTANTVAVAAALAAAERLNRMVKTESIVAAVAALL